MRHVVALTLVAAAIACRGAGAGDKAGAIQKELEDLKGTWVVVSAHADGDSLDDLKGAEFTFASNKLTQRGKDLNMEADYQVDPSKGPKWMDIRISKPAKRTIKGIYQIDGDKMRMCIELPNYELKDGKTVVVPGPRPTKFESKQGELYVLERKKK